MLTEVLSHSGIGSTGNPLTFQFVLFNFNIENW